MTMDYEHKRLHEEDPWVQALYERAFPENERCDLRSLMQRGQDIGTLVLILRDGKKVGFYCALRCLGLCHVIYFAVPEELRGQGIGSSILQQICETHPGDRVIVDVERENAAAGNAGQRTLRKQFYVRNGFAETEVKYRWRDEDYEILSRGGNVTRAEWHAFWDFIDSQDRKLLY